MLSTMKTLERAEAVGVTAEKFEGKDVLKQVVIGALAVAPDASSIVYVRRTVEDGKYARRLWRTTFEGGAPDQLTSAKANDGRPRFSPGSGTSRSRPRLGATATAAPGSTSTPGPAHSGSPDY